MFIINLARFGQMFSPFQPIWTHLVTFLDFPLFPMFLPLQDYRFCCCKTTELLSVEQRHLLCVEKRHGVVLQQQHGGVSAAKASVVCSQDICCVCSHLLCLQPRHLLCLSHDICGLPAHLNGKNYDMRAAAPRACCDW